MNNEQRVREVLFILQRSAKVNAPGLVNFIPAVAYHICLNLPAAFTQPVDHLLAEPSICGRLQSLVHLSPSVCNKWIFALHSSLPRPAANFSSFCWRSPSDTRPKTNFSPRFTNHVVVVKPQAYLLPELSAFCEQETKSVSTSSSALPGLPY